MTQPQLIQKHFKKNIELCYISIFIIIDSKLSWEWLDNFFTEVLSEKVSTKPAGSKKELFGELESAVPGTTFLYLARYLAKHRGHVIDLAIGGLGILYRHVYTTWAKRERGKGLCHDENYIVLSTNIDMELYCSY